MDVQADRLEMEIVGWGRDEESWSIAYHVIPGDVTRNEVWEHLEGLLLAEYLHASGLPMRIVATCIDCGFKDAMSGLLWKTTHDDLRLAVETSSGGCD